MKIFEKKRNFNESLLFSVNFTIFSVPLFPFCPVPFGLSPNKGNKKGRETPIKGDNVLSNAIMQERVI